MRLGFTGVGGRRGRFFGLIFGLGQIAAMRQPVLVVAGEDDDDNGSARALADALPDGRYVSVPGNHMSAVVKREFGTAIADFLTA